MVHLNEKKIAKLKGRGENKNVSHKIWICVTLLPFAQTFCLFYQKLIGIPTCLDPYFSISSSFYVSAEFQNGLVDYLWSQNFLWGYDDTQPYTFIFIYLQEPRISALIKSFGFLHLSAERSNQLQKSLRKCFPHHQIMKPLSFK